MPAPRGVPGSSAVRLIALVAGTVAVLYLGRQVFVPLAIALTISFLLTPLVAVFQRIHLPRLPSVILAIALLLGTLGTVGWVIAGQLLSVISGLPQYRQNIQRRVESLRGSQKGAIGKVTQTVKDLKQDLATSAPADGTVEKAPPVQVVQPPATVEQYLENFASPLLAPLAETLVVVIFTVFLLVKKEDVRNRMLRLAGVRQLNVVTQALDDAASRVSRYLVTQALVNTGFAIVAGTGLHLIGLPNAALFGALAGLLRIVPYIGALAAVSFPFVLSLAVFDTWLPPLLILLLYGVLEIVVANFIEPWLYGARTGISPLAILVSAVFWSMLWGPAGLVLSMPLTVCLVVLGSHVPELSFLQILLGDEPVLSPQARVYQRLLAMDPVEAREVADLFLKEKSLLELYDVVLIPALSLAEQDRHKGALDQAREEFLFLNMNEMISEFSERDIEAPPSETGFSGRVICFPVNDEADQIAAAMLSQVLEQMGYPVVTFPPGASVRELLAVEPTADDVVFTSAVPPLALAHSKAVYKQLRAKFPKVRIVACIWGYTGDLANAKERFDGQAPSAVLTSLAEALKYVVELNGDRAPVDSHAS